MTCCLVRYIIFYLNGLMRLKFQAFVPYQNLSANKLLKLISAQLIIRLELQGFLII